MLFIVLPLNISDKAEKVIEDGNDTGAPNNPQIFKKFLITTIISIIIWSIMYMFLKDQGLLLYILDVFYSNEVN
jgi:predicted secreted protein